MLMRDVNVGFPQRMGESHPLWKASAQTEGGICQFSTIRAKKSVS